MVTVYAHKMVRDTIDYYGQLLFQYEPGVTIKERLSLLTSSLWAAFQSRNQAVLCEINNYHPNFLSQSWTKIEQNGFKEQDAQIAIARQYGYKTWEDVPDTHIDIIFENAVDLLLAGALDSLAKLLEDRPDLLNLKSRYGHQATLLHYVGNNGVELYRQVLPSNLPDMMCLLLESGADRNARMNVYGGEFTMIDLLNSSAHPYDSGMHEALISVYNEFDGK